jgi:hypothetical protein
MNIDQDKLNKITEALGWLRQAENHHRWLQHTIADDCLKKARVAINDPCFDRVPIAGFARNQQPEVIRVVADTPLGFAIINGVDFNPEIHQLYTEPTLEKPNRRTR